MASNFSIQFLGAAGTVTGSRHLLKSSIGDVMIDCGLFQGLKALRLKNWEPLPIDINRLKGLILTHAHLDHCGHIPLLYKQGYRGPIYCTGPTRELAEIILRDSAKIQEEDAAIANKKGYSKHKPAEPLYTVEHVEKVLPQFEIVNPDAWLGVAGIKFRFRRNGHILGSAFVETETQIGRITFSGDVGRPSSPLLHTPEPPAETDFLVMESTYGDRLHSKEDTMLELADVIIDTIQNKGNVLIPSFAVGRAQELMHLVNELKAANKIPDVPVFLDTPMGANATNIYKKYPNWHKLTNIQCNGLFEKVKIVSDFEETFDIIDSPGSKIIIAASGMLTGGRVLYYLEKYLDHRRNTILFTGYQGEGTRGKALQQGVHEIKMHGSYYPVRAAVRTLSAMSGHADQREMLDWMSNIKTIPKQTFLVHGENNARDAFRIKIESELGWKVSLPQMLEEVDLTTY